MNPTYYITTLGCPKNQADSREMERSLRKRGFSPASSAEKAQYHIINTCSFIEPAREETIQVTLEAAGLKTKNKNQKLILSGCFSERYEKEINADLPEVDFSFGTGKFDRAGELIDTHFGIQLDPSKFQTHAELNNGLHYAPLKISDGCNRSCTFCSIPQFRGKFRDVQKNKILEEARRLAGEGVREINIVSQDTVSYGKTEDLLNLIEDLHGIDGIEWIRMLYLYPDKKTENLLNGFVQRRFSKIVPYFESPLQHVSDSILRRMKRSGSMEYYKSLFTLARSFAEDVEIRTSFIIGFPGELESDVENIMNFMEELEIEKVSFFPFYPEENTPAFTFSDTVPDKITAERINGLRNHHLEILRKIHRNRMGKVYKCLVDSIEGSSILARRPQDAPEIDESVILPFEEGIKAGDFLNVKITGFYEYDMTGKIEC